VSAVVTVLRRVIRQLTEWKMAMPKRGSSNTKSLQEKLRRPPEPLDDKAIQRILNDVGYTPESLDTSATCPPDVRAERAIARKRLSDDIDDAAIRCCVAISIRSRRKTFRQIDLIVKTTRRLKTLLENENTWTAIAPHISQLRFEAKSANPIFSRNSLDALLDAVAMALHPKTCVTDEAEGKVNEIVQDLTKQSIFETLIGELEKVFVTHFDIPARIRRPKHEDNDAPFIRFVKSVLRELKLDGKYTDEAIIHARTVARSGRGRRKAA
jgi:hypothetical protein